MNRETIVSIIPTADAIPVSEKIKTNKFVISSITLSYTLRESDFYDKKSYFFFNPNGYSGGCRICNRSGNAQFLRYA